MLAVLKLSFSRLRKSKLQNVFIALLILLSTLLVSTAFIVLANTGNQFEEMHARTNGSHQVLTFEKGLNDPQADHDWWTSQKGVDVSPLLRYRTLSGITFHGEQFPNIYLYMIDTPEQPWTVDKPVFANGTPSDAPTRGTIWIPTSMSNAYDISLGDTVSFNADAATIDLVVSGIRIDVPYGAPFTNTARIWMNEADYRNVFSGSGKDYSMIGLHFDDYETSPRYWDRYADENGIPFLETKMEFESIASFYLIIHQIVGFIMIFLGIVMLIIALMTIGFTISDSILANYRTIGILKSLGFTSLSTIGTYAIQYALLAFAAILPGTALSLIMSRFIIGISTSSLRAGNEDLAIRGTGLVLMLAVLLFLLVILFVIVYASKAGRIQPVQAIRYGMSETDHARAARRMNLSLTRWMSFATIPVGAAVGMRNIMKYGKSSLLLLLLTTMASSVLVFGYALMTSITEIHQTAAKWGYDQADIAAVIVDKGAFPRAEMERALEEEAQIENVAWQGNVTGITVPEPNHANQHDSVSLALSVLDGNYRELGFETLHGNDPVRKNEISIGVGVSRMLNKDVGDLIELYIEGQKRTFIITGTYQAIANMSISGRITAEAMRTVDPDYSDADVAFIQVRDKTDAAAVAKRLNEPFQGSVSVVTQKVLLDSVYTEAANVLIYPMCLIGMLFLAVTFIIIFSTCRINIRKESRTYGIYKSLGMTSRQLRLSIAAATAGVALVGSLFGIAVGVYLLPFLLETVLSGYGIVDLPLILNGSGILMFSGLSIPAAALGSWASSRVIREASPRDLVVE